MRDEDLPDLEAFIEETGRVHSPPPDTAKDLAPPRDHPAIVALVDSLSIDLKQAQAVSAQYTRELYERVDAEAERAVAASEEDARQRLGLSDVAVADDLTIADAGQLGVSVIDTMSHFRAWPDTGAALRWNLGPQDNWVKYRFEASDDSGIRKQGTARLSFYALWQNPRSSAALVDVVTQLSVVGGQVQSYSDWNGPAGLFGPASVGRADVSARLTVWSIASGINTVLANTHLASSSARGGFLGDSDYAWLASTSLLTGGSLLVAPFSFLMIETSLVTNYELCDGSVRVNAAGWPESWRVACPYVVVTIR